MYGASPMEYNFSYLYLDIDFIKSCRYCVTFIVCIGDLNQLIIHFLNQIEFNPSNPFTKPIAVNLICIKILH
jgi:hypothetical protein